MENLIQLSDSMLMSLNTNFNVLENRVQTCNNNLEVFKKVQKSDNRLRFAIKMYLDIR